MTDVKTRYVLHAKVLDVSERVVIAYKNLAEAKTEAQVEREEKSIGWFIHLEGSREALFLSMTKPEINKGDTVKVSIEVLS